MGKRSHEVSSSFLSNYVYHAGGTWRASQSVEGGTSAKYRRCERSSLCHVLFSQLSMDINSEVKSQNKLLDGMVRCDVLSAVCTLATYLFFCREWVSTALRSCSEVLLENLEWCCPTPARTICTTSSALSCSCSSCCISWWRESRSFLWLAESIHVNNLRCEAGDCQSFIM